MRDYIEARTIRATNQLEAELKYLGMQKLHVQEKDAGILGLLRILEIRVYLDNPKLPEYLKLLEKYNITSDYATEFTKADIRNAEWFEIRAKSWLGYPKPEHSWKENTYDLASPDYCHLCGAGLKQVNPFRLGANQPKSKKSSFFAPGWVFDEVFVTTEVQQIFRQSGVTGVEYLAPLRTGTQQPFDKLRQLVVMNQLQNALVNHPVFEPTTCDKCDQLIHRASRRAKIFNQSAFVNAPDFVRTSEWFGNGKISQQSILVSRKVYDLIQAEKWRGIRMQPVVLS